MHAQGRGACDLRDEAHVFETYWTTGRGVERAYGRGVECA